MRAHDPQIGGRALIDSIHRAELMPVLVGHGQTGELVRIERPLVVERARLVGGDGQLRALKRFRCGTVRHVVEPDEQPVVVRARRCYR